MSDLTQDDCDCELDDSINTDETDVVVDADSDIKLAAKIATVTKYAPVLPPVKGSINLYAVALVWLDDAGADLNSVKGAGNKMAAIYKNLSNGYITFKVIAKRIKVDFNKAPKNISKAEKQAINTIGVTPSDKNIYAIVNHNAKKFSNAGNHIAHLQGTLTRDFCHEVGHLDPFSLGHSGAYKNGKLEPYGDGTSFMGSFASDKLTGAQLYLLGWLSQRAVAQYDLGDAPTNFNIESLFADKPSDNVKVVLIPRGANRPLYVSMPQIQGKPTLCLHLSSGRGSQRVAAFGNKAEYQGVLVQKVATGDGFVTVQISTTT
jgi:hypothetical protein